MQIRGLVGIALWAACGGETSTRQNEYPVCAEVATAPGALAAKAAVFDEIAQSLHVRPGQDLLHNARLAADLSTFEKAIISDNSGLWTSVYGASQAFRYAATHEPQALANLKRALQGSRDLMRITGVPGLFARSYVDPSLPGFPSGEELTAAYSNC